TRGRARRDARPTRAASPGSSHGRRAWRAAGRGGRRENGGMRLKRAIEAFAEHLEKVRRLSPATVRAYRSDLTDLAATLDDGAELVDVDLEHLREWLWRATQRGDARSTIARRTSSARALFAWALDENLVAADPSLRLVTPKKARTLP